MRNNIEKNKISGNNNQIIGGDQNNITNVTNYTCVESVERTTYRKVFYLNQIKNSEKFVKVSQFENILIQLEKQNAIMLVGCSGIGKTSFSFIISNYFMQKQNYNFRFVTAPKDNDFDNILNLISENEDEREIVIIDDFLGNAVLNLSEGKKRILETFINLIDSFYNKKFILTTRKTILKQLLNDYKSISLLLNAKLSQIDLDTYTEADKCNIFIYHCQKNGIIDNIKNLLAQKIWNTQTIKDILNHTNFTPLIIECSTKLCEKDISQNYYSIILSQLEHPENIWEKEIKALDSNSRKYINILLSLSNSSIKSTTSDECFYKYMQDKEGHIDYVVSKIHRALEILIKSDGEYLSFVHPSLIEYLDDHVTEQMREDIINSALYLEQIEKMDNTKDSCHIKALINVSENKLPKIFSLKVLPLFFNLRECSGEYINIICTHYLKYLYQFRLNDDNHQWIVIEVLKEILKYDHYILSFHSDDVVNIFNLNYEFSEILESDENLQILFSHANSLNVWCLLYAAIEKSIDGYDYSKMQFYIKKSLLENLIQIGSEQLDIDNIIDYVIDEMDNYDEDETFNYDDIIDAVRDSIYDNLDFYSGKNAIEDTLKKHSIINFIIEEIDDNDLFECFWENNFIEDEITDFLNKNYSQKQGE